MLCAAFIMAVLDAGVALRDVQIAARHTPTHAPPRSTTDATRTSTHAAYAVVAYVSNG